MYSDFNVSIFGTSSPPQLSQLSHSKIQIEFILERTSVLGIPDESAENAKKQAVAMEQKQEASASTPPPSSSSSSSENQISYKEVASKTDVGEAADVDDGYHTPTSPRHRIPPAIECPPAPKKPRMPKRWRCIRVRMTTETAETRRVRLCALNPTVSARGGGGRRRRRRRRRRPEEM